MIHKVQVIGEMDAEEHMYKEGKWASEIIALQEPDGKWGWFHSLSKFSALPITTEQALRRLERLGYTIEDNCIQKAVLYMDDCITGKTSIPDRREKLHDWDIFTSLILATWIRRFTLNNTNANKVAKQWADIITYAFAKNHYNHDDYVKAYQETFGIRPSGGRLVDFVNFYPVSLLANALDVNTERSFVDYVMSKENGIYYVYDRKLMTLPNSFESKEASHYLGAVELLSKYNSAKDKLQFVVEWLNNNKNAKGNWDMGKTVNDKVYFPLSDSWRAEGKREYDCTERIKALINELIIN